MKAVCLITCALLGVTIAGEVNILHPDAGLNAVELIKKHGYPVEEHTVQTTDGYILQMQRINLGNASLSKGPVLFLHGLTSSSGDFINGGPGRSLAYSLVDLGYDVWLGNIRGNMWGRKHATLDPELDASSFWDFSFQELASYDIPAMVDYVLAKNGADKLFYIGHSQGTAAFFAFAADNPQYNDKIRLMTALAPVAFLKNLPNPFPHLFAIFTKEVYWLSNVIGLHEILPKSALNDILSQAICIDGSPLQGFCKTVYFLICGFDSPQLNASFLPVITTNLPAGSSSKQFLHLSQGITSGKFRKFDYYDAQKNNQAYGQNEPPEYDLTKITAPVALHYGQNDWMVGIKDLQNLKSQLPNVVLDNKIAYKKFNHGDFLWANDVVDILYNDVIATIEKY